MRGRRATGDGAMPCSTHELLWCIHGSNLERSSQRAPGRLENRADLTCSYGSAKETANHEYLKTPLFQFDVRNMYSRRRCTMGRNIDTPLVSVSFFYISVAPMARPMKLKLWALSSMEASRRKEQPPFWLQYPCSRKRGIGKPP